MRSSWLLLKIPLAAIADIDISFFPFLNINVNTGGGLRSVCPGVHIHGGCRYGGVHNGGGPQRSLNFGHCCFV